MRMLLGRLTLLRLRKLTTMERAEKGQRVSWKTVHGISSGTVESPIIRKKDNAFLGYVVRLDDKKIVIVHPNSFINGSQTKK